jgi:hypothetical protein
VSQYHDSVQLQVPLGVMRGLVGYAMGLTEDLTTVDTFFQTHPLFYDEVVADYVDQEDSDGDRQAVGQPLRGVWRPSHRNPSPAAAQ